MSNVSYATVISFFTFMMFWTLNSTSGKDMNDVVVDYWQARIEVKQ
jgi:hypothetical protein